jgi:hypothetical protein
MIRPSRGPWRHGAALLIGVIGIATGTFVAAPAAADPQIDYVLHCRGCHGPDGGGAPGGAPSFRGQIAKFLAVPGGREYLIRVPGSAQSELTDARLAALLNWMVRAFSAEQVPADFVPFGPVEIARLRRAPLTDAARARHDLLRAIAGHAGGTD